MYTHTYKLENVMVIDAQRGAIRSLAVHSTQPYLLSSADDHLMKLWDWDMGWVCTRSFERDLYDLHHVCFNPMDANTIYINLECV